jgi:CheY-like chemotaxis protein
MSNPIPASRGMSILVVEDERPLAHALDLKLQHEGFSVTIATDGQQALTAVNAQHFDVMLLDLIMPVMDGFQVLERLHNQPGMPLIFVLSNLSQHEDEGRAMALGAYKFFIKSDTSLTVIIDELKKVGIRDISAGAI